MKIVQNPNHRMIMEVKVKALIMAQHRIFLESLNRISPELILYTENGENPFVIEDYDEFIEIVKNKIDHKSEILKLYPCLKVAFFWVENEKHHTTYHYTVNIWPEVISSFKDFMTDHSLNKLELKMRCIMKENDLRAAGYLPNEKGV